MPSPTQPSFHSRVQHFWRRVTEGLELNQLWKQFQVDARASYRLYSRDVDFTKPPGERSARHFWNVVKQFFWAILEQLSPARRVLLLLALVLVIFTGGVFWHARPDEVSFVILDLRFLGALLLLLLLLLEVGDRVIYILNAGSTDRPVNVISRLMVDMDVFVGNNLPLADDVTCMLIKVTG